MAMHRLLKRQLKKYADGTTVPDELHDLMEGISETYFDFDEERELVSRSLNISTREFYEKQCQLEDSNNKWEALVEAIPNGIFFVDGKNIVTYINNEVEIIFGKSRNEIVGKNLSDLSSELYISSSDIIPIDGLLSALEEHKGKSLDSLEYTFVGSDYKNHYIRMKVAPSFGNDHAVILGMVISIEDVTIQKETEERLKYLSLHDSLTGLYNRTFFEETINCMEHINHNFVGIIMIDIDGLKIVNDTIGHEEGDRLLQNIAGILKSLYKSDRIIARFGGDEFSILFPRTTGNELEKECFRIKEAVKEFNDNEKSSLKMPLSVSIGAALNSGGDISGIFKESDNNMHREKLHHRQSFRSAIVDALTKAMEARDFHLDNHGSRMQDYAEKMARAIGLSENRISDLRLLARFHDIGKVGIPDSILFKPGPLNIEEAEVMRKHCEIGYRIAQSAADLMLISDWILKHHEWWNGQGYPLGLGGTDIPLECRIISLVDAYDAMTSDRPYRKAMKSEDAISELVKFSGIQFDSDLVSIFIGTVVCLGVIY